MTTKVSDPRLKYHRTRALSEIKNQSDVDKSGLRGIWFAAKSSRPKGQALTNTYSPPPAAPYPPIPAAAPTSIDVTFSTENVVPQSGVKVVPGGGHLQSWPQPPPRQPPLPQESANGRISTHYSSDARNVGSYHVYNPAGGRWNVWTPPPPAPYPPLPRSAPGPVLVPNFPEDNQSSRGSPSAPPPRTIQPRERDPRPENEHWLPPLPPPPYWKHPPELGAAMRPAHRQATEAPHGAQKSVTHDDKNGGRSHPRGHQPMYRQDHHYKPAEERAPPQRSSRPPQGGASNLRPGPTGVCGAGRQATEAPRGTQNSVINHDKNGSRSHMGGHQQMYRQYDHYRPAEEKAPPQRSPRPSQGGVSYRQPGLTKVCGAGRDFTSGNDDAVHGARTSGIKIPRDQDEDKLAEITSKIIALDLNTTTKSTVQEAPADVPSKAYMSLEEYKAAEKAGDVVYKGKSTVDELYASGKAYNSATRRWIKVENAKKKAAIDAAPALLANVAMLENTVKLLSQRSQLLENKAEMLTEQSGRPTATLAAPTAPKLIVFDTNCFINSLCGIKCRVANIVATETDTSILIPKAVLTELDGLKRNDTRGFMAREATRYLMSLLQTLEGREYPLARFQGDTELYRDDGHHKAPENLRGDASILNSCLFFAHGIKTPRKVTLVTGDNNFGMQAKANCFGVEGNPQCLAERCPRPFCPVKSRQQSLRGSFP